MEESDDMMESLTFNSAHSCTFIGKYNYHKLAGCMYTRMTDDNAEYHGIWKKVLT